MIANKCTVENGSHMHITLETRAIIYMITSQYVSHECVFFFFVFFFWIIFSFTSNLSNCVWFLLVNLCKYFFFHFLFINISDKNYKCCKAYVKYVELMQSLHCPKCFYGLWWCFQITFEHWLITAPASRIILGRGIGSRQHKMRAGQS